MIEQQINDRGIHADMDSVKEAIRIDGISHERLMKSMQKITKDETDGTVLEALMLRQQLAKSSVKKYQAMENAACKDNRCRGMFQFYGANRTGRFARRLVQLQNLPQNPYAGSGRSPCVGKGR